jgi:alkyl hydroperoxide reductase subunit AhpC
MSGAKVGEAAPEFELACVDTRDERRNSVRLRDYAGRWLMLVFYPRDFSFVCPTELTAFSAREADFRERGCALLGVSVDPVAVHQEWLTTPPAEGDLGPLQFPLASDPDGAVVRAYGVWVEKKTVSLRGLFLIDPQGVLQYAVLHNLNVGRRPDEVVRVLEALQTGGLCPAAWTSADGKIDVERVLQPGRVLGQYRIRQQLGSGAFGTVFAAWDLRLERTAALKVLKRKYDGMMVSIPAVHWQVFRDLSPQDFATTLRDIAAHVQLARYRKHPRGPKKKPPRRSAYRNGAHVSTAQLLATRKKPKPTRPRKRKKTPC